jgi:hypothetical protein
MARIVDVLTKKHRIFFSLDALREIIDINLQKGNINKYIYFFFVLFRFFVRVCFLWCRNSSNRAKTLDF